MMDPADYRLYRSQTAVMAAIRQAVGAGYRYYLVATKRLEGEEMRSAEGKRPLQWVAWRKEAWLPTYELRRDPDTGRLTWFLVEEFYRELLEEALHHARKGGWPKLVGHLKTCLLYTSDAADE